MTYLNFIFLLWTFFVCLGFVEFDRTNLIFFWIFRVCFYFNSNLKLILTFLKPKIEKKEMLVWMNLYECAFIIGRTFFSELSFSKSLIFFSFIFLLFGCFPFYGVFFTFENLCFWKVVRLLLSSLTKQIKIKRIQFFFPVLPSFSSSCCITAMPNRLREMNQNA